jgi:hypothetical protein
MALTFSGVVEDDLNTLREIISGMPASAQHRARSIAEKVGKIAEEIKRDNPKDPAAGIGLLFAVLTVADHMTHDSKSVILRV